MYDFFRGVGGGLKVKRLSAFSVEGEPGKDPLDFVEYSKLKYGHRPTSAKFAEKMAKIFVQEYTLPELIERREDIVISTSPYWFTPPSANSLAIKFHFLVNELLYVTGKEPLPFIKIHRSAAPSLDFGKLSLEERKKNMARNRLSADPLVLRGKTLVIVEDARITGAHEKKIIDFARARKVKELVFVYVVAVSYGSKDPDIENRMNHQWVNNLEAVYLLMRNPEDFILNSRACRLVLGWKDAAELEDFCRRVDDAMVFKLYTYCVNDGYGSMANFKEGFNIVRAEVSRRYQKFRGNNPNTLLDDFAAELGELAKTSV